MPDDKAVCVTKLIGEPDDPFASHFGEIAKRRWSGRDVMPILWRGREGKREIYGERKRKKKTPEEKKKRGEEK